MKQYALEYGKYNIRFNGINADRIKSGLLTEKMILKRSNILFPINDSDNQPIKVIKIMAIIISRPGMLYGK